MLNFVFSIGAFYWIKMIIGKDIKTSGKKRLYKGISYVISAINIMFVMLIIALNIYAWLEDATILQSGSFDSLVCLMNDGMIISSTIFSGTSFCIFCYMIYRKLKILDFLNPLFSRKVKQLAVYSMIFCLFRIIQNLINMMSTLPDIDFWYEFKQNAMTHYHGVGWTAYVVAYFIIADICPTIIFLTMFSPSTNQQDAKASLLRKISGENILAVSDRVY